MRPTPDRHSAAFWDGLRRHEVVVQHCQDCGLDAFPHLPTCPRCARRTLVARALPGTGTVYSWIRVHRALSDHPVVPPPYVVATVDLDRPEGETAVGFPCRVFGRLLPHEGAAVGLAVRPDFTDHEGWTELTFSPGAGAPGPS